MEELVDPETHRSGKRTIDEMNGSRGSSNDSSLGKAKEDDAVTVEIEAHPPSSMSSLSLCEEKESDEDDIATKCKNYLNQIKDLDGNTHTAVRFKSKKLATGKTYTTPTKCKYVDGHGECCKGLSRVYCLECGSVFCYPLRKKKMEYDDELKKSCFYKHIYMTRDAKGDKRRKFVDV